MKAKRVAKNFPVVCVGGSAGGLDAYTRLLRHLPADMGVAIVLDIDDTVDVVHGHQQLSLFNAHYDERCFLPIHVYDTATGRPVAMILRPGKTPSGTEVRGHLRRLVRRIRRCWPTTRITIRGDGHYSRPEVMDWCEANGVDYVFGLTGTKALAAKVEEVADAIRVERAVEDKDAVRGFAETTHAAKSWKRQRRVSARIEATRLGLDIRYVVTNIATGTAEWLYADLYCARGQAENLIKLHKAQLASDRTSCRAATANQMRLVLHTAAYWLILAVRDAIPKAHALAKAEFTTIRLRLLKVAARVTETASRVRVAFASRLPGRRPLPPLALSENRQFWWLGPALVLVYATIFPPSALRSHGTLDAQCAGPLPPTIRGALCRVWGAVALSPGSFARSRSAAGSDRHGIGRRHDGAAGSGTACWPSSRQA